MVLYKGTHAETNQKVGQHHLECWAVGNVVAGPGTCKIRAVRVVKGLLSGSPSPLFSLQQQSEMAPRQVTCHTRGRRFPLIKGVFKEMNESKMCAFI